MKTNSTNKIMIIFTMVSLIMISCGKETNSFLPASGIPDNQPVVATIGSVVDQGIINENTRIMSTDLTSQNFTLYGTDDELSYVTAQVKVAFYVNTDGLIPSGEYTFSSSDSKAPFTFDSGVLILANGSDSASSQPDQMVNGVIVVNQDGGKYVFELQIELASGMTFSQRYDGSLVYSDSK